MTHYCNVFRGQLAIKYTVYGHALWGPNPPRLETLVVEADSTDFSESALLFPQTIHLTSLAYYQNAVKH